jgi:hypothetical protein
VAIAEDILCTTAQCNSTATAMSFIAVFLAYSLWGGRYSLYLQSYTYPVFRKINAKNNDTSAKKINYKNSQYQRQICDILFPDAVGVSANSKTGAEESNKT